QRYGVLQKTGRSSKGGLAPWQKIRASEILHENMHGRIRLSDVARECGLSTSHFARSFKTSFGISTHQWLIQHRIEHAKELMVQTTMSLLEIAVQSGFTDQAAFHAHFPTTRRGKSRNMATALHESIMRIFQSFK